MTSTNNAAANAAPAAETADSVNVSKPARKHLRTSSEAHKKPARSLPSSTSRKKACQTAAAKVPTAIDASDTVPEQRRQTKASVVEALMTREGGASLEALCGATGWQAHTCRAFLTGLRKRGREVIRATDKDGKSIYLIAPDRSAASSPEAKQVEAESK
jgi:hypothetical protein